MWGASSQIRGKSADLGLGYEGHPPTADQEDGGGEFPAGEDRIQRWDWLFSSFLNHSQCGGGEGIWGQRRFWGGRQVSTRTCKWCWEKKNVGGKLFACSAATTSELPITGNFRKQQVFQGDPYPDLLLYVYHPGSKNRTGIDICIF